MEHRYYEKSQQYATFVSQIRAATLRFIVSENLRADHGTTIVHW
jgi:hypothetical protein